MATSTAVKNKYNKKTYENFNVRLRPDLYNRIDTYCKENNISRSQFLLRAIDILSPEKDPDTQNETV